MTPPTTPEDFARRAYDAYGKTTDWKNFQGKPMPTFVNLPPRIQQAWVNAALAVLDMQKRGYKLE